MRAIRDVAESVDHRVISGEDLLVRCVSHDDMRDQLKRFANYCPAQIPVGAAVCQKRKVVIILVLLGSLLRQGIHKFGKGWIAVTGRNSEVNAV